MCANLRIIGLTFTCVTIPHFASIISPFIFTKRFPKCYHSPFILCTIQSEKIDLSCGKKIITLKIIEYKPANVNYVVYKLALSFKMPNINGC